MIVVNLDIMLVKRKMKVGTLAKKIGISVTNVSLLKNRSKAIRFDTLDKICKVLNCTPADLLEYVEEE